MGVGDRPIGRVACASTGRSILLAAPTSRDKILEVAEALFARRGFSGVGMREVAEAAGLGKSSLFHHFRSKSQLYFEVLDRVLQRIEERLAPAIASSGAPLEKLDRGVDALVDALAEHPATARLLLRSLFEDDDFPSEAQEPEQAIAEARLQGILDSIRALLTDGVEQGVFRAVSVPHTMQTLIGATVYHFASGELGEKLLGQPLLAADAVRSRKQDLRSLLHHGLVASTAPARRNES
jgi:AcrR family transcriptional regulator